MGEYATIIGTGREVKIGTCESMYYIRFENRNEVDYPSKYWKGSTFRVPVISEDGIRTGEYSSCFNTETKLVKAVKDENGIIERYEHYAGDKCTLDNPGTLQIKHECGLLVNVPCYHGQKLPEVGGDCKSFWNNATSDNFRLSGIKYGNERDIMYSISCRWCNKTFSCDLDEISDYIECKELLKRLRAYQV